ncbi:MAG: aromatic ring-hydroxylating dioxygenase subunit alpha [Deltaproteobacteria bacterium]|nr:aromatic ring-hydroxylating dioxygenase subunit alpha [Deltaproteobacteria bacterium]
MIPNKWYPIEESSVVRRRPHGLQRMGLRLVLFRGQDGRLRCMRDRCPHRGVALSRGRVRGDEIECPYHGFRFDGDGRCTRMPCEGHDAHIPHGLEVDVFPVREAHGLVWLWWGAAPATGNVDALPPVPWFPELPTHTRYAAGSSMEWPTHYVRAIESNFDLHHGPFVHGNIFSRKATRVDPIEATVEGERIHLQAVLRPDDGEPGRSFGFRAQFVAPSLTLLHLTDRLVLVVADCPIDETTTWRYARYYNEIVKIPGLGKLLAWLVVRFEWDYVQRRQDLPIVRTMTPRVPVAGSDKLVRADVGTARYLQLRRRLLAEAAAEVDDLPPHVRATLPDDVSGRRSLPVVSATG